jgi:CheY-like chemotaxis protein/anti-sigma regulatory factor (Ser/Thr protein kinase)
MSIEQVDCHLDTLLAGVESLMQPHAHKKGLKLEVVRDTLLPQWFLTDPTRLRQVLMNLVGNAIKFTEQGSVTIRVSGQEQTQGALLKFDVEDTGVGLDEEQAKRLFSAFSQSDTSVTRKHGGTGLGLVLCKRLARLLGGDVTITRSKLGEGSVFTATILVIPVSQPDTTADSRLPLTESTPPQAMASMTLCGRILLAEDGPDNQRLIALILRRAGAEVDVAANGRIALDMLTIGQDEHPYDLLITDIQMPEMDGYTLTARVRAMGMRLPIIALTAHVMAEDRERCLSAGCNDFATKPIDKTALIAACARWLHCSSPTDAENETIALPLAP